MSRPTTDSHLTHAELATTDEMAVDCRAVGRHLRYERIAAVAHAPAPSLHFSDYPVETPKPSIEISEAAARLANALHLHLD
jgi:hypothetical protein